MGTKFEDMIDVCESSGQINFLPFSVEFDGKANVGTRFNNLVTQGQVTSMEHEDGQPGKDFVMHAEFRGKPLQGRELKLPSNYEGHVATDLKQCLKTQPQYDGQIHDKTLRLTSKFDSFTYWNWDKPPSGMDSPLKLVDWMNISEILHTPIQLNQNQENDGNSHVAS